ncbi:hypothetical protein DM02DRAFT_630550 [Periconia macrospinosa]|uniref:Uncharacterized protein n=1 Tax=Periconia macrospinosa TaxID=97972 RepID=A0A2V1DJ03_9PLEO|nr:hypothetical protein DM02DRAFT_630550 [Periconia macrospinosa]
MHLFTLFASWVATTLASPVPPTREVEAIQPRSVDRRGVPSIFHTDDPNHVDVRGLPNIEVGVSKGTGELLQIQLKSTCMTECCENHNNSPSSKLNHIVLSALNYRLPHIDDLNICKRTKMKRSLANTALAQKCRSVSTWRLQLKRVLRIDLPFKATTRRSAAVVLHLCCNGITSPSEHQRCGYTQWNHAVPENWLYRALHLALNFL